MSGGFVIPRLHLIGQGEGDRELDFNAVNVRRDDARYTLAYGIPGRYGFLLDYNKIPHHFGNDGHMLWTRTGPGRLEIADPVQAALQGAIAGQFATSPAGINFAFLNHLLAPYLATAQAVNLGLSATACWRGSTSAGWAPSPGGSSTTRRSAAATGPTAAASASATPPSCRSPSTTTPPAPNSPASGTGANGLSFGYRYSKFKNNVSTLIWDNPFRVTGATDPNAYTAPGAGSINGSNLGFADLAAGNRADILFLIGRTRFGSWFANGSASYNR